MRGEELDSDSVRTSKSELPPHARRRARAGYRMTSRSGITSACAEKRHKAITVSGRRWNYLRMRGEEKWADAARVCHTELPPHARRRVLRHRQNLTSPGITSACAEKSVSINAQRHNARNYLRMRGEERPAPQSITTAWELPPHARRRAAKRGALVT